MQRNDRDDQVLPIKSPLAISPPVKYLDYWKVGMTFFIREESLDDLLEEGLRREAVQHQVAKHDNPTQKNSFEK